MSQEQLTLELLAPYLPHKLYVLHYGDRKVLNTGYGSSVNWIGMSAALRFKNPKELRPLLHPLSRLTEEHLKDINDYCGGYCKSWEDIEYRVFGKSRSLVSGYQALWIWNYLISKHYDVGGLIDKGLAEAIKLEKS